MNSVKYDKKSFIYYYYYYYRVMNQNKLHSIRWFENSNRLMNRKRELQGFWNRTKIEPKSNRKNLIINFIIIVQIKLKNN